MRLVYSCVGIHKQPCLLPVYHFSILGMWILAEMQDLESNLVLAEEGMNPLHPPPPALCAFFFFFFSERLIERCLWVGDLQVTYRVFFQALNTALIAASSGVLLAMRGPP